MNKVTKEIISIEISRFRTACCLCASWLSTGKWELTNRHMDGYVKV